MQMSAQGLGWYMSPMNEYIKSMKWVYTNQVDVGQWKHEMGLNKAIFM